MHSLALGLRRHVSGHPKHVVRRLSQDLALGLATPLTFTRASTAYRHTPAGILQSVAVNAPRHDHDPQTLAPLGILLEDQRTNLLLNSADMTAASWTISALTRTANTTTSPDGTVNADTILETATTAIHIIEQTVTKAASSLPFTVSVYVKANGRTSGAINLNDNAGNGWTMGFNLATGTVATSGVGDLGQGGSGFSSPVAAIDQYQNGWYRIRFTITTNTATSIRAILYTTATFGTLFYAGNASLGLYLFGFQLEQAGWASSYIPTTTAAATRQADICALSLAQLPGYSSRSGTWIVGGRTGKGAGGSQVFLSVDDGSENERIRVYRDSSNVLRTVVTDGGAEQANLNLGSLADATVFRVALRYGFNNTAAVVDNNSTVVKDATATIPTPTIARIGAAAAAGSAPFAHVSLLEYYDDAVIDATLIVLSGPTVPQVIGTISSGVDLTMPAWVTASANSGFFSSNANISASVLGQANPFYDLRVSWKDMNPSSGVYDWSAIDAAMASGRPVWTRMFFADSLHVPQWVKDANPTISAMQWVWGGVPYTDIVNGQTSAGLFYPIWRSTISSSLATFLTALGDSNKFDTSQLVLAYFPGMYLWGEYTLHFLQAMNDASFTPANYTSWLQGHFANFVYALGGAGKEGKVVFTGPGHNEWIEPNSNFSGWNTEVNEADGVMARSKHMKYVIDNGGGARSGFTEAYNGFADACNWGTRRTLIGSYYYSTHDETHPLADAANNRIFSTEQEDFGGGGSFLDYFNAYCVTLALRMNWAIPYEQNNIPHAATGLYDWARKGFGKTRANAADAFCRLRQYQTATNAIWGRENSSLVEFNDSATVFRNFERWLIQRDVAGDGVTVQVQATAAGFSANSNGTNYEGLSTNTIGGTNYMYFALDDTFHSGAISIPLDLKVTYWDAPAGNWKLEYKSQAADLDATAPIMRTGAAAWKTATFRIGNGLFTGTLTGSNDFRLNDMGVPLQVHFVRVVKVNAP